MNFLKDLFERFFQSNRLGGMRRSSGWREVRNKFAKENPGCAVCGKRKIQVHHVVPFHIAPERELEGSNLISLCQGIGTNKCHINFGHLGNWSSWNETVREDAAHWKERRENRPLKPLKEHKSMGGIETSKYNYLTIVGARVERVEEDGSLVLSKSGHHPGVGPGRNFAVVGVVRGVMRVSAFFIKDGYSKEDLDLMIKEATIQLEREKGK